MGDTADYIIEIGKLQSELAAARQELCAVQRQLTNAHFEKRMTSIRCDEAKRQLAASQERERKNDADYRRIHIALFGLSPSQGDATASGIVFGIERLQAKIRELFSGVS